MDKAKEMFTIRGLEESLESGDSRLNPRDNNFLAAWAIFQCTPIH